MNNSIKESLTKNKIKYHLNDDKTEIIIDTGTFHNVKVYENILEVCIRIKSGDFEYMDEDLPKVDREKEMLDFIEEKIEDDIVDMGYERNMYLLSGNDNYCPTDIFEVYFQNEFQRSRLSITRLKKTLKYLKSDKVNQDSYSLF